MPNDLFEWEATLSEVAKEFIRNRKAIIRDAVSGFENPKKRSRREKEEDVNNLTEHTSNLLARGLEDLRKKKGKKKTSYHSHVTGLRKRHYVKDENEIPRRGWEQYVIDVGKLIEAKGTAEISALEIQETCGGSRIQVRKACQELMRQGRVIHTGKARAIRYHWGKYASDETWLEFCHLTGLNVEPNEVVKTTTTTIKPMIALPYGFNDMVSFHPPNPAKLQDLPETPDSAVLKDVPPRPDETIYEGGGVKIYVKDNNIIVSCLQLTHSYCVSTAQLASCTIFDEKYRDRFFAIACLLRDLYDDLDTYPQDLLQYFSCGPNLHGGQEFTFLRFSGETFPHDSGYQIESVKKAHLEGEVEDNFYQACLDHLVDLLKRKNRDNSREDCISTLGAQDLVKVDHCCCTKPQRIAVELTAWEADQSVHLKAANARGDNMILLAIGHWVRRLLHNWFSCAWRGTHAPDCKWVKYKNDLEEIANAKAASTREAAMVLEVQQSRYASIKRKRLDHLKNRPVRPVPVESPVPVEFECFEAEEAAPKKLRFKAGQNELISLAWIKGIERADFDPLNSRNFKHHPETMRCRSSYIEGIGTLRFPEEEDADNPSFLRGDTKFRVATIAVKWPIKRYGNNKVFLDIDKIENGEIEVLPWVMSLGKYSGNLVGRLAGQTLKVFLPEDKKEAYQDFTVIPQSVSILQSIFTDHENFSEELYNKVIAKIRRCIRNLEDPKVSVLGQIMTYDEIRQKLGLQPPMVADTALNLESANWAPITPLPNRKAQPSLGSRQVYQDQRFESQHYNKQDASRSKFQNCKFVNCTFEVCDFEQAVFQGCTFTNCTFDTCDFERAVLQGAQIIACNFNGCDFERADLTGCMASPQTVFSHCDVELAQTHGSNIRF